MQDLKLEPYLKHEKLKELLAESIVNGKYKPGERIPSQNELADIYGISHSTVRESLASLVNEGLIYRIQGKGTFVAEQKQQSYNIALVLPSLFSSTRPVHTSGDDITARIANGVEEEARKNNSSVMLYLDQDQAEIERLNLEVIPLRNVDAVILFYIGGEKNLKSLKAIQEANIPVVLIDRSIDAIDFDFVTSDNKLGAQQAVEELIKMGFEKIYHFSVNLDRSWTNMRLDGYNSMMQKYGLEPSVYIIEPYEPIFNINGKLYDPIDVISKFEPPYAIFAENALVMSLAWETINKLRLPYSQFALACFDEPYINFPPEANIVKIIQQLEEIGRESVRCAIKKLNGDMEKSKIMLATKTIKHGRLCR